MAGVFHVSQWVLNSSDDGLVLLCEAALRASPAALGASFVSFFSPNPEMISSVCYGNQFGSKKPKDGFRSLKNIVSAEKLTLFFSWK